MIKLFKIKKFKLPTKNMNLDLKVFRQAVESSSEHMVVTDLEGIVLFANDAVTKTTGFTKEEVIGKTPALWGRQMTKEFYEEFWNVIKVQQRTFEAEIKNRRKNGDIYFAEAKVDPVFDEDGKLMCFLGIERDITERKTLDQRKKDFVSMVSHQLKNPFAQIQGYVDNMLDGIGGPLSLKQTDYMDKIKILCVDSLYMVNDLLEVSKLDRGIFEMNLEVSNLCDVYERALVSLKQKISKKNIQIDLHSDEYDKYILVSVDFHKAVEIVRNVLDNAIKFSPSGGKITIGILEDDDFGQIFVQDQGPGIAEDYKDCVFAREKILSAHNKSLHGVGLGMYLAKEFVTQMNGDISFESKVGEGTKFVIKFKRVNQKI
jgi:PAS domain S-box-containing protein